MKDGSVAANLFNASLRYIIGAWEVGDGRRGMGGGGWEEGDGRKGLGGRGWEEGGVRVAMGRRSLEEGYRVELGGRGYIVNAKI